MFWYIADLCRNVNNRDTISVMKNAIIEDYVRTARQSGFSDNQIVQTLSQAGWPAEEVGQALASMPGGKEYDRQQVRKSINKWLISILKTQTIPIIVLSIVGILTSLIGLLDPWPIKLLTDSVFGDTPAPGPLEQYTGTPTLLYIVAASMVFLFVLTQVIQIVSTYLRQKYVFDIDKGIKTSFFSHVLRLPLSYKGKLQSGDYVFRQNAEASEVSDVILNAPIDIGTNLFTVLSTLFIMVQLDIRMTIFALLIVPPLFFTTRYFSRKIEEQSRKMEEVSSKIYAHTTESIENVGLVQSFGKIERQTTSLLKYMTNGFKENLKMMLVTEYMGMSSGGIIVLATFAVTLVGGNQIFDGNLSFGELLVFITYLGNFFMPVEQLLSGVANFRQSYAVIERVYEVLDDHREVDTDQVSGKAMNSFTRDITFSNAAILHDDITILSDVNITIKKGMKVGLIGSSGAGKSTLIDAINRTNPHTGYVGIDGYDVNDININSLRSLFSTVRQEPGLFSDSIYNNIIYGIDEQATPQQVIAAAQAADAHDFIMQLPEQYQTDVGEAGAFLSGGQLQRIAIARAFLRNSPILLMDEPTSALDVEGEKRVMQTMFQLMQDRTVLMISHKMSLLTQMDMVLVVESGKVMDVKAYGGLERYLEYLRIHELV